jgi:hypothetical protein
VRARPAEQGALAAGDDALAAAGGRLRDEGGETGVADLGATHLVVLLLLLRCWDEEKKWGICELVRNCVLMLDGWIMEQNAPSLLAAYLKIW